MRCIESLLNLSPVTRVMVERFMVQQGINLKEVIVEIQIALELDRASQIVLPIRIRLVSEHQIVDQVK